MASKSFTMGITYSHRITVSARQKRIVITALPAVPERDARLHDLFEFLCPERSSAGITELSAAAVLHRAAAAIIRDRGAGQEHIAKIAGFDDQRRILRSRSNGSADQLDAGDLPAGKANRSIDSSPLQVKKGRNDSIHASRQSSAHKLDFLEASHDITLRSTTVLEDHSFTGDDPFELAFVRERGPFISDEFAAHCRKAGTGDHNAAVVQDILAYVQRIGAVDLDLTFVGEVAAQVRGAVHSGALTVLHIHIHAPLGGKGLPFRDVQIDVHFQDVI